MTRSDELEQAWVSMSRLALRLELQSDSWQTQTTSPSGSLSESLSAWPSAATARGAAADALTPWPVPSASTMAHHVMERPIGVSQETLEGAFRRGFRWPFGGRPVCGVP